MFDVLGKMDCAADHEVKSVIKFLIEKNVRRWCHKFNEGRKNITKKQVAGI